MFFRLLLLFLLLNIYRCCSKTCFFLWDNTSGSDNFVKTGLIDVNIRNIITIDGTQESDHVLDKHNSTDISFINASHQSVINLTVSTDNTFENKLHVKPINTNVFIVRNPFENSQINIQISASHIDGSYKLFNNRKWTFKKWNSNNLSDRNNHTIRISDIVRISANVSEYHKLNFISACNTSRPTICLSPPSLSPPTLGHDYNISCVGSGAPYLTLKWKYDETLSVIQHPATYDTSRADHVIRSVLTLTNYSLQHSAGVFKCIVTNTNFGDITETVFRAPYPTEPVQITSAPLFMTSLSQEEYSVSLVSDAMFSGGSVTTLQWNVTGWPLDNIHIQCNTSHTTYSSNSSSSTTSSSATFTVKLISNDDVIKCGAYNLSTPLSFTTLYRVGWNCSAGEQGVGLQCVLCDPGYTSSPGSDTCYQGNSTCIQGQHGEGGNCPWCPWSMTSNNHAVKEQECYKVTHLICPDDYFFNNTFCNVCPFGYTSQSGAAKLQDCVRTQSTCPENYYTSDNSCSLCPEGKISSPGAVKEADCETRTSSCSVGHFGVGSCELCPWGETTGGVGGVVKIEECFTPLTNCSANYFISVNCTSCQGRCNECQVKSCTQCPTNHTSVSGAAKSQDCSVTCPAGWYLAPLGWYSVPTAGGGTSNIVSLSDGSEDPDTASNGSGIIIDGTWSDGTSVPSTAGSGEGNLNGGSGYEAAGESVSDTCLPCPEGTTSPPGSTSEDDCQEEGVSAQVVFVVGVLVVMVLLGLVMVATIVRHHLRKRYKERRVREFFEKQKNVHGTNVLKSEVADRNYADVIEL